MSSARRRVWITDHVHPTLISGLGDLGYDVENDPSVTQAEVEAGLHAYCGIVINSKTRMHGDLVRAHPGLRFIARLGSGLDIIDLDAAAAMGVACLSAPEGNRNAVAEHALGMLLSLLNRLSAGDAMVRSMAPWNREACRGMELDGRTVGILGYGNTGRRFADKLRGFDVRVLSCDPYIDGIDEDHVDHVDEATLLSESDVLSLHVQLTDETRHWLDAARIERLGRRPILINTSRGAVVETRALVDALEDGRLAGACLDVHEVERPEAYDDDQRRMYDRLFACHRVLLTPHVAGWTTESRERIARVLLGKIEALGTR